MYEILWIIYLYFSGGFTGIRWDKGMIVIVPVK